MAIYTGFFDAAYDEAKAEYDRLYDSADFTEYFENIVGSGVCVYENDDSMAVFYDAASQRALVNPGYLFIRGYWLKNDGLYGVDMANLAAGDYVIVAHLNMARRLIEIVCQEKSQPEEYIDSLVLAYATADEAGNVTITDTRGGEFCGLIDSVGSLSAKVGWALNYINTEIDTKLAQIQQNLQQQSDEIDGKIEEANSLIAKIAPPAVGTIKFSASQDVEEDWLRCDGSFINEVDYPELVAALGKLIPSPAEWTTLSDGEMGTDITNGVTYAGKVWVYSWKAKKLYGVDPANEEPVKEISVSSEDAEFLNMVSPYSVPTALSVVGDTLFLVQFRASGELKSNQSKVTLLCKRAFTGQESSLTLEKIFPGGYDSLSLTIDISAGGCLPYIAGVIEEGSYTYYLSAGGSSRAAATRLLAFYWSWKDGETPVEKELTLSSVWFGNHDEHKFMGKLIATGTLSKYAFSSKNQGELVVANYDVETESNYGSAPVAGTFNLVSYPQGLYTREAIEVRQTVAEPLGYVRSGDNTTCRSAAVVSSQTVLFDLYYNNSEKKLHLYEIDIDDQSYKDVIPAVQLPSYTIILPDSVMYLQNKDIWLIFVGSGFLFSRDIRDPESFGFLDTSETLGVLSQYGHCWYDETTSKVYILGQSTDSRVVLATLELPQLFNYANDGAWLPMIASDGVPAYIKALGEPPAPEPVIIPDFQVTSSQTSGLPSLTSVFSVTLDGVAPATQINFEVPSGQVPVIMTALQDYTNQTESGLEFSISVAGYGSDGYAKYSAVVIVGKVLQKGEKITAGESVTGYYDFSTVATYPDVVSVRITYTTKAAQ